MSLSSWRGYAGYEVDAVFSLRARLWDAGFRPVAVYNAELGNKDSGKAPKGNEWQLRARLDPPEACARPAEPDAFNTGILCDGLRAIDIDVDDRELSDKIKFAALARFGDTSIRYRDNSGRVLLVYRAAEGEPTKRAITGKIGKIEALGRGQHFVAFGEHFSGTRVQWLNDPPGDACLDHIPKITEDDIAKLFRFAEEIIDAKPENYKNGSGAVSIMGLQAADALQIVAAICAIPNDGPADWEGWNRVGMAVWAATSGSEAGRAAFHAWSQQHASYDQAATTARWDHYRTSPPTKIGAGTLFRMARQSTREPDPEPEPEDAPPPASEGDYGYAPIDLDVEQAEARQSPEPAKDEPKPVLAKLFQIKDAWEEKNIPHRPWVAPGYLLRGAVTALAGPGSAGKSSLVVAWTAAHSMGMEYGRFRSFTHEPARSLFYNVEDDQDEQRRRYSAMARRLSCTSEDLLENLLLCGPEGVGTLLKQNRDGDVLVNTEAMSELEDLISKFKPDTVWLDPFVELHGAEENDNTAIRAVMARFRLMAKMHGCAVGILFHTRKGPATPGDPDSIRGASAIVGAGRIALTVSVMTKEEAEKAGVDECVRRDYFRVDDAKKNYSRVEDAEWFERVEYELDNGDRVAIPSPWTPPSLAVDQGQLARLVDLIGRGSALGPWSPRISTDARSVGHLLASAGITVKGQQTQTLGQLKSSGLVYVAQYKKPRKVRSECPLGLRTSDGEPRSVEWWDDDAGDSNG